MGFFDVLKNIFDILALTAILFFIYRFAVKRKAFKLVMGVVLFLLVMLLVDATQLTALGFVFGDFRHLGVIAILIIFQPELRSALEKIGGTTFEGIQNINHGGSKRSPQEMQAVIDAIARSAQMLSDMKYGSIVVIERKDRLDDHMGNVTRLDSIVTAEALNSIFYKGGALHDGAVVIRDGRIECARCILPMSQRTDMPSHLGTRHGAALGVTDKYDSVVVVVSEETGTISLSINGSLERGFSYTTLKERLDEIFNTAASEEKDESKIKKLGRKGKNKVKKTVSSVRKNHSSTAEKNPTDTQSEEESNFEIASKSVEANAEKKD